MIFIYLLLSQLPFLFGCVPCLTIGDNREGFVEQHPPGKYVDTSKKQLAVDFSSHVTLKALTKAIESLGVPRANFNLLLELKDIVSYTKNIQYRK